MGILISGSATSAGLCFHFIAAILTVTASATYHSYHRLTTTNRRVRRPEGATSPEEFLRKHDWSLDIPEVSCDSIVQDTVKAIGHGENNGYGGRRRQPPRSAGAQHRRVVQVVQRNVQAQHRRQHLQSGR